LKTGLLPFCFVIGAATAAVPRSETPTIIAAIRVEGFMAKENPT
jgi:hypothetical protein